MIDLAASIEKQRTGQVTAEGCLKTPEDLARYRAIIDRTRPDSILECGTFSGKSALWFSRQVGHPRVLSMDVSWASLDPPTRAEAEASGVLFYLGDSVRPVAVDFAQVWAKQAGRIMVVLDSNHSARHVLAEMEAYSPLVASDCYLVVEDGIIRWIPFELAYYGGSGPLDAIAMFMERHGSEWEIDRDIEDMLPTTQFPDGWLRRRR